MKEPDLSHVTLFSSEGTSCVDLGNPVEEDDADIRKPRELYEIVSSLGGAVFISLIDKAWSNSRMSPGPTAGTSQGEVFIHSQEFRGKEVGVLVSTGENLAPLESPERIADFLEMLMHRNIVHFWSSRNRQFLAAAPALLRTGKLEGFPALLLGHAGTHLLVAFHIISTNWGGLSDELREKLIGSLFSPDRRAPAYDAGIAKGMGGKMSLAMLMSQIHSIQTNIAHALELVTAACSLALNLGVFKPNSGSTTSTLGDLL